jgi:hypothetical protein
VSAYEVPKRVPVNGERHLFGRGQRWCRVGLRQPVSLPATCRTYSQHRRLEEADGLRLADNRPGGKRRVEAFQRLRLERLELESAAQQPPFDSVIATLPGYRTVHSVGPE